MIESCVNPKSPTLLLNALPHFQLLMRFNLFQNRAKFQSKVLGFISNRRHRNDRPRSAKGRNAEKGDNKGTKYEWVAIEEFNSEGLPTLPRQVIQSTQQLAYDADMHTDLDLHISTGMSPEGSIMGQYKIYEINKFSMQGWRMRAHALVELDLSRVHEESWFNAYRGINVLIKDPGLPGSISNEYRMKVIATSFTRKAVSFAGKGGKRKERQLLQADLEMKEMWRSTLLRRKSELFRHVLLTTIAAFIAVMLGKLV